MQRQPATVQTTPTPTPQGDAPARGPRVIDPSEFKFIAGGAPRNGWQTSATLSTDTLSAPRNGW